MLLVTSMRIRILPFILMRIRMRILASKQRLKTLKGAQVGSYSIHPHHLQIEADPEPDPAFRKIRIIPLNLMRIHADPDPQH